MRYSFVFESVCRDYCIPWRYIKTGNDLLHHGEKVEALKHDSSAIYRQINAAGLIFELDGITNEFPKIWQGVRHTLVQFIRSTTVRAFLRARIPAGQANKDSSFVNLKWFIGEYIGSEGQTSKWKRQLSPSNQDGISVTFRGTPRVWLYLIHTVNPRNPMEQVSIQNNPG